MCMNKINSDSSEQVHSFKQWFDTELQNCYMFKVWICSGYCGFTFYENIPLDLSIIWWWYAFMFRQFSCILKCVISLELGSTLSHGLIGKRDKAYKEQSHYLLLMLTGLHEILQCWWCLHRTIPKRLKRCAVWQNSCLSTTRASGLYGMSKL